MRTLCWLFWVAALIYQLGAWVCLARLWARPRPPVVPRGPGVTVFKPVKGWEPGTRECLESFLTQSYGPYEVLFGVADPQDPALPELRALARRHPEVPVAVVVCPENRGHNPKVSILQQLAPRARYDLLVIADADVRVGPDFLGTAVAALARPGMGLVSCPYRAAPPCTLGAMLESLTIAGDFIPSVAVARYVEGVDFALGAAMAFTRRAYEAIGGFAPLADYLADDYQLGHRIRRAGFQVDLLPYVVETGASAMSLRDYVLHQLRWSRTYRVCRPRGYLAYGITQVLVFALAGWGLSGWSAGGAGLVAVTVAVRLGLSWYSLRRCLQGRFPGPAWALVPLKDLMAFGFWLLSFPGKTVTWRGRRFRLSPDGRLKPWPEGKK
ncbi:MAG: bacteriohopanetetrol glucosamine biosynthesis glycosyltransferase HpnI [Syntrophobacterales bacterium]|nr:bacteriohopanetetrol glucosamine biosynthesis glycosyltransferase HpnI [Syntrophobacterales bacterium]